MKDSHDYTEERQDGCPLSDQMDLMVPEASQAVDRPAHPGALSMEDMIPGNRYVFHFTGHEAHPPTEFEFVVREKPFSCFDYWLVKILYTSRIAADDDILSAADLGLRPYTETGCWSVHTYVTRASSA